MLTSKFMTSQPTWEAINFNAHIAQYHRKKSNQKMKYGQFIDIAWETFFLENHAQNVVEKLFQKSKLNISLDQWSKVL